MSRTEQTVVRTYNSYSNSSDGYNGLKCFLSDGWCVVLVTKVEKTRDRDASLEYILEREIADDSTNN